MLTNHSLITINFFGQMFSYNLFAFYLNGARLWFVTLEINFVDFVSPVLPQK